MTDKIEFVLPAGDQIDLETSLFRLMFERADEDMQYAIDNPWGEFLIQQGDELHSVQWTYVGLENTEYEEFVNENGHIDYCPIGEWYWEYDEPDFEVSCSWLERKLK
jgi:hypothetical protein